MNMKKIVKPSESDIEHLKVYLPPRNTDKKEFKRTLLLDLDETLIHCFTPEEFDISPHVPDLNLQILGPDDQKSTISISIRPYAYEFLSSLSKLFEIAIFTASSPLYANKVLDILDPNNQFFTFRIFRQNCYEKSGLHIKDLRIIANRELRDVLLVDNFMYSYSF